MKQLGYLAAFIGGTVIGGIAVHFRWKKRNLEEVNQVRSELKQWYKDRLEKDTKEAIAEARDAVEEEKNSRETIINERVGKVIEEVVPFTDPLHTKDEHNLKIQELKNKYAAAKKAEERKNEAIKRAQKVTRYIIRPDEYGTLPDYGRFRYTYYEGNERYVNSDYHVPVEEEEVLDMIGPGIPDHFGEYEDDTVYVRNDELKTDIAIYLADGCFDE